VSRWARGLRTAPVDAQLDLPRYLGQRSATFEFSIVDALTGYRETLNPLRDSAPEWSHNTERTIKRQITGLNLGVDDTARFRGVSSRLDVAMLVGGRSYPLGRYVPYVDPRLTSTGGDQSIDGFYDEMYVVDQEITAGFGLGIVQPGGIEFGILDLLKDVPVTVDVEPTIYANVVSWPIGTSRGQICEHLALDGDYLPPWFDNENVMRFIRTVDPEVAIPTFDYDTDGGVIRANVVRSTTLIDAPNRFVIISNGSSAVGDDAEPVAGIYDVPDSAPHSIRNRGFVIQKTETRQLQSNAQAQAVARSLGLQHTLVEQLQLQTVPDPRYDSYDVVRWQGVNWLEISRSMQLVDGTSMQHIFRRSYR
jgi:hypothetical protein